MPGGVIVKQFRGETLVVKVTDQGLLKRRMLRCAIYTRKSTEEGLEQNFNTLDAQRDAAEAFIRSDPSEQSEVLRGRGTRSDTSCLIC
jgi:hypothetical protein